MPIGIYVATDLSMLNDCSYVSKHLELYSISYISPDMSLFSIFNKGKIPQHIPRYHRKRLYL